MFINHSAIRAYDQCPFLLEPATLQAVYGTLFEAEHRSTFYFPYWKFPPARWIVPRQRKFQSDLKIINDCLDGLIQNAKETRQVLHTFFFFLAPLSAVWSSFCYLLSQETDVEKLQERDYSNLKVLLSFTLR